MIKVRINGEMVETTPGRLMFNEILPEVDKQYHVTFGKSQLKNLSLNYMMSMDLLKQQN